MENPHAERQKPGKERAPVGVERVVPVGAEIGGGNVEIAGAIRGDGKTRRPRLQEAREDRDGPEGRAKKLEAPRRVEFFNTQSHGRLTAEAVELWEVDFSRSAVRVLANTWTLLASWCDGRSTSR